MRILFVTSTRIGDAVLSTGLLDHLLRAHPAARITVACGPVAEGVFERMPRRDRTLVVEKRPLSLHWPLLWSRVALTRWDLVVDLRGSALGFALRAGRRAVMRGGRRPGHRLRHIAAVLGLDPPPLPVAWWDDSDADRAAFLLPGGSPWLVLGPTANWSGKVWPADRYAELARSLTEGRDALLPGARIAVLGGPGPAERAMAAPVLAALPGAADLVGALTLPEAAACLARAALFVGNDSGLMHLSAAAGAPTLGLFGPTPAAEYAPRGPRARAVEADGPRGTAPMDALPVPDVLRAAADLLRAPVPV